MVLTGLASSSIIQTVAQTARGSTRPPYLDPCSQAVLDLAGPERWSAADLLPDLASAEGPFPICSSGSTTAEGLAAGDVCQEILCASDQGRTELRMPPARLWRPSRALHL